VVFRIGISSFPVCWYFVGSEISLTLSFVISQYYSG
jgi:hypothetical protein